MYDIIGIALASQEDKNKVEDFEATCEVQKVAQRGMSLINHSLAEEYAKVCPSTLLTQNTQVTIFCFENENRCNRLNHH